MKKKPFKKYEKETGLKPIVGITADESALRTTSWLIYGCNVFGSKREVSRPMSVWTEQDILQYIKENNIIIPSVYGNIVEKNGKLCTTCQDRTGCIFCLIGCHLEKGDRRRFVRLAKTHPKIYKYCMEELGMKEILDYIHDYCHCKEELY